MSFFAPLMLFGLLGAAVPVVFHLMRRSSARTIVWGAYMFLLESLASRRRRMRIEEALLLACRILAVLLLALALARPFLPEMKFGGGSARDVVIVIDSSASMGVRQADGRTNFSIAVDEARELVKKAPRGTAFGLVTGGAIPRTLTPAPISDKREFFTLLDSLREPENGTMDAHRTLSAAAMVLAAGNRAGKQIALYGDGQAAGWDAGDSGRWKVMEAIFSRLPVKPQVVWRTLAAPETIRNVGVLEVVPERDVVGSDRETSFRVSIVNTGTEAVTPGEVSLLVDGRSVSTARVGTLLPGSVQTLELRHRFDRPGAREVSAAVSADDDLPSDDRATTVVHVIDALHVWIVEGNPAANRFERAASYLSVALKPMSVEEEAAEAARAAGEQASAPRRSDFLVEPRVISPALLERAGNFDTNLAVVVLADVPRLPASAAKNLADFVFRGGGLLVSAGAKAQPGFYNGWKRGEEPLLPFPLKKLEFAEDPAAAPLYAPDSFTGDALSALGQGGDLATVRAAGRWLMDETPADERFRAGAVDGRFDDGRAAFASRQFGRGRVIVSALPLDASLSQLPARTSFVPLVHELVCHLADATVSNLNIPPSEGAVLTLSSGGRVNSGAIAGLDALYWPNPEYSGTPCAKGTVPNVDFDWRDGPPAEGVPADRFSCRFTGMLSARKTGRYMLQLDSDDGGAIYIDGKRWNGGWLSLTAGSPHSLRVDSFENNGLARAHFNWHPENGSWEPVPADCLFRYTSGGEDSAAFSGPKTAVEIEDPNGVRFGAVAACDSCSASVRISRPLTPGVYRIHLPESGFEGFSSPGGETRVVPFSVQDRAIEGDMTRLGGEALETVRRSIPLAVATKADDVIAAVAGRTFGVEIWRPLALWALLFLVAEILLTRWIAIGRRTGERQEISFSSDPAARSAGGEDGSGARTEIRATDPRPALIALPVLFVLFWCAIRLLSLGMHLATPWPAGAVAAIAAAAVAAIVFLYDRERAVVPVRTGRALFALRLLCVFIALWMLLQPVLSFDRERRVHRRVAVLLDESLSMFRRETQWTTTEKFDVAQSLGFIDGKTRPLAGAGDAFEALRTQAAAYARILEPHGGDAPADAARATGFDAHRKEIENAAGALAPLAARVEELLANARADRRVPLELALSALKEIAAARDELHAAKAAEKPVAETLELLGSLASKAEVCLEQLPALRECEDEALAAGLDDARRAEIDAAAVRPRIAVARDILAGTNGVPSLLEAIAANYDAEFYRFGTDAAKTADAAAYLADAATNGVIARLTADGSSALPESGSADAFRAGTDLVRSLETVLNDVPSEELAGALVVTDGRHTGGGGLEAVARRFAHASAPVSSVVVGGTLEALDLSLADVSAAESVFLGDRVRANVRVLADGLKGGTVKIRLMLGDEEVDSRELKIENDGFSAEVRLTDEPKERGVRSYRVEAVPVDGETELANNEWPFEVSVSDDRVNVLLVDRRPRWEFRYLRNLFYARDKSVHLQYLLTEPDRVSGRPSNPPPASASRAFGDAEAGALPVNRDEWRKFDVIVIGDVGENTLTPAAVKDIKYCVEERGATLVFIAGRKRMPDGIRNPALLELLPVVRTNLTGDAAAPEEDGFRVTPTPAGRSHACMALSDSPSENERIWSEQPLWRSRIAIDDIKPGAEVLAYAEPVVSGQNAGVNEAEVWSRDVSGEDAVKKLDEIRKRQARNAIIVAKDQGRGKTVMLLSDDTWRLRYRVGDTLHHRFWGQILRWGVGERMRAGNEFARLGTDRLSYEPGASVRICARLSGPDFTPLNDIGAEAVVSLGGTSEVSRVRLTNVQDSNGVYEGRLDPAPAPGRYTVRLECRDAERALGERFPAGLSTVFTVSSTPRPVEFTHITADGAAPRTLARLSGGRAVGPLEAASLADGFGEAGGTVTEHVEISFWDRPWLFLIYLAALVLEWILRYRNGLA